jgi:hypothetical protein
MVLVATAAAVSVQKIMEVPKIAGTFVPNGWGTELAG